MISILHTGECSLIALEIENFFVYLGFEVGKRKEGTAEALLMPLANNADQSVIVAAAENAVQKLEVAIRRRRARARNSKYLIVYECADGFSIKSIDSQNPLTTTEKTFGKNIETTSCPNFDFWRDLAGYVSDSEGRECLEDEVKAASSIVVHSFQESEVDFLYNYLLQFQERKMNWRLQHPERFGRSSRILFGFSGPEINGLSKRDSDTRFARSAIYSESINLLNMMAGRFGRNTALLMDWIKLIDDSSDDVEQRRQRMRELLVRKAASLRWKLSLLGVIDESARLDPGSVMSALRAGSALSMTALDFSMEFRRSALAFISRNENLSEERYEDRELNGSDLHVTRHLFLLGNLLSWSGVSLENLYKKEIEKNRYGTSNTFSTIQDVASIDIVFSDHPGTYREILLKLRDFNFSIVRSHSETIIAGDVARCKVEVQGSITENTLGDLRNALMTLHDFEGPIVFSVDVER